jgi:hypothetical protein
MVEKTMLTNGTTISTMFNRLSMALPGSVSSWNKVNVIRKRKSV